MRKLVLIIAATAFIISACKEKTALKPGPVEKGCTQNRNAEDYSNEFTFIIKNIETTKPGFCLIEVNIPSIKKGNIKKGSYKAGEYDDNTCSKLKIGNTYRVYTDKIHITKMKDTFISLFNNCSMKIEQLI